MDNVNSIGYHNFTRLYRSLCRSQCNTPFRVPLSSFKNRIPITSYGCIVKHKDKFCCLKRSFSVEYTDFLRGNYRDSHLYFLLRSMTNFERELLKSDFNWQWTNHCGKPPAGDPYGYAFYRWNQISRCLPELVASVTPCDEEGKSLWLWPKGRIDYHPDNVDRWSHSPTLGVSEQPIFEEAPIECALREFREETGGYEICKEWAVSPDPLIESYIGTNSKNYETCHFCFIAPDETEFKKEELVSENINGENIYWLTYDQILESFPERRKKLFQSFNWENDKYTEIDEKWSIPIQTCPEECIF